MLRLQLIVLLISFFSFSGFGQSERIIETAVKVELTKSGLVNYLEKWTPRLEEAVATDDTKSVDAIAGRLSRDLEDMKAGLSEVDRNFDKTFIAYVEQLERYISIEKNYRGELQLMSEIIKDK